MGKCYSCLCCEYPSILPGKDEIIRTWPNYTNTFDPPPWLQVPLQTRPSSSSSNSSKQSSKSSLVSIVPTMSSSTSFSQQRSTSLVPCGKRETRVWIWQGFFFIQYHQFIFFYDSSQCNRISPQAVTSSNLIIESVLRPKWQSREGRKSSKHTMHVVYPIDNVPKLSFLVKDMPSIFPFDYDGVLGVEFQEWYNKNRSPQHDLSYLRPFKYLSDHRMVFSLIVPLCATPIEEDDLKHTNTGTSTSRHEEVVLQALLATGLIIHTNDKQRPGLVIHGDVLKNFPKLAEQDASTGESLYKIPYVAMMLENGFKKVFNGPFLARSDTFENKSYRAAVGCEVFELPLSRKFAF